jgi:ADP-ribose pyrophosphatase YjhB (NUDIX family)
MAISENRTWKGLPLTQIWLSPEEKSIDKNFITQVSGICITEDKKILLLRNSKEGNWYLPGGTPERDETVLETLNREVFEEATVILEKSHLLGIIENIFPNNPNKDEGELFYQLRYISFLKEIKKQTLDPSSGKVLERIFVSIDDFFNYVTYTPLIHKEIINLTKRFIEK